MICGITPIIIGAAGAVLCLVLVFDATHSLADSVLLARVRRIDGSGYLADDRVIKILVLVRCRDSYTAFRLNPPTATLILLLVLVLGARGTSSPNSANFTSFLLILCCHIHSYSERQLGLSDGLLLGLMLGTREGLGPGMPFGFTNRSKPGLRLGTREGVGLGLSLGFSGGLVLGLRLRSRDVFGLSDELKFGLRVCPGLQLGADV